MTENKKATYVYEIEQSSAHMLASGTKYTITATAELQNKIKEKVKETTDLDVKEVNITVKKAIQEKQTKIEKE